LFSALLNPTGKIGAIILNSNKYLQLYSCDLLNTELLRHRAKLLRISNLSETELDKIKSILCKRIIFVNETLLPSEIIAQSETAIKDVDADDTPFVALACNLKARLWTGDKKLVAGLEANHFIEVITTVQLSEWLATLKKR
jgi:predicted nucleic acid-binding protein